MADIDYSKISTADLENIQAGKYEKVSTNTLEYLTKQAGGSKEEQPKSKWQSAKDTVSSGMKKMANAAYEDLAEPGRILGETGASMLNLPVKAYKGWKGGVVTADNLLSGKGLEESLKAGTEAIGDRNAIKSPFEPSKTSRLIGENIVQPAVNRLSQLTGQPQLVEGIAEAAGDIAGIFGIKGMTGKLPIKPSIANALAPEAEARAMLGKETGVNLTPADITGKKSTALLESQLDKNMGSTNKYAAARDEKIKQVGEYAEKVQKEFGGKSDAKIAGDTAIEKSRVRHEKFLEEASKRYDAIPVDPKTPIVAKSLSETATEHLEELGKINNGTIKGMLSKLKPEEITSPILDAKGKPIVSEQPPAYTWEQLRNDRSALLKLAKSTGDFNRARIYRDLASAINEDTRVFADTAKDPGIKSALIEANRYYREGGNGIPGVEVWRDKQIANTLKTNSTEDIVGKYFTAKPNLSDIERLKSVTGPEGFQELKKAWLDKMISQGNDDSFGLAKFASSYDRFKRSGNLDVILEKTEREGLEKIYDISRIAQKAEKMAGNPSGTAQNVINSAYHWISHPVVMTISQFSASKIADMYFSNPTFRKYLTNGLEFGPLNPKAKSAGGNLAKILASNSETQQVETQPSTSWGQDNKEQ